MASKPQPQIVVAFLDKDQGFALDEKLPWPHLKGDYKFYTDLSAHRDDPSKKNAHITGRISWKASSLDHKANPDLVHVVTSSTLQSQGDTYLQRVCPTLDDAINYVTSPPVGDQIENVWIMGGGRNYNLLIDDPRLKKIWVTRVFGDFKANVFFPKFQHKFKKVKCDTLDESMQEDNGVQYQFELWERFSD